MGCDASFDRIVNSGQLESLYEVDIIIFCWDSVSGHVGGGDCCKRIEPLFSLPEVCFAQDVAPKIDELVRGYGLFSRTLHKFFS